MKAKLTVGAPGRLTAPCAPNPVLTRSALALTAMVLLGGCPKNETDDAPPQPSVAATPTPAPTPVTPTAEPTTSLVPESPVAGIAARIKAEVDGKDPDPGARGSTVVAGKATFASPSGWNAGKSGIWSTVTAPDSKAAFAAGNFGASESATGKLTEAASALGYTDCQWAPPEGVSVGKDKLPGSAADGVCKQGGAQVKTAYIAFDSMKVLSLGGWAEGGDATGVFSTFRHTKGVKGGGGDSTGIRACCQALAQNANSAPPEQKGAYLAAAATCNSLISNPQGRAVLGQVRALLGAASVPASCR